MVRFSKYRSPQARARHKRVFFLRIMLWAFFACGICAGILVLLLHSALSVHTVRVLGAGDTAREEHIRAIASREADTKVLFFLSRQNTFLYPTASLENAITRDAPEFKNAAVRHESFRTVLISVEAREPFALWCGDIVPLPGEPVGECYTLDTGGIIFTHGNALHASSTEPYFYGALGEGLGEVLGAQFLDVARFARIVVFIELLRSQNLSVQASVTLDENEGELHLMDGTRILYRSADDPTKLARRLALLLESENAPQLPLEYIDLRFGDRVYVKRVTSSETKP